MPNRLDIKRISNEEFEKLVSAVADSATTMVQGQKFDGRATYSYEDIRYYYSKIDSPNTNSHSFLIATRTAVDKEYFPDQINSGAAPIKDRVQLKQLIHGDFRQDLKSCLDNQSKIAIELINSTDGIRTRMTCEEPLPPRRTQPRGPALPGLTT